MLVDLVDTPPRPTSPPRRVDPMPLACAHSLTELRELCRERGLPRSGTKEQVARRLAEGSLCAAESVAGAAHNARWLLARVGRYMSESGSATEGVDFEAARGTLSFAPGQTLATITIKCVATALA